MTTPAVIVLTRAEDRVQLDRLRGAVRADTDRSAMIYADTDLVEWIRRSMTRRGWTVAIEAPPDGGVRVMGGDPEALVAIRRAMETARFD